MWACGKKESFCSWIGEIKKKGRESKPADFYHYFSARVGAEFLVRIMCGIFDEFFLTSCPFCGDGSKFPQHVMGCGIILKNGHPDDTRCSSLIPLSLISAMLFLLVPICACDGIIPEECATIRWEREWITHRSTKAKTWIKYNVEHRCRSYEITAINRWLWNFLAVGWRLHCRWILPRQFQSDTFGHQIKKSDVSAAAAE
jgi:hypothetical protein